MSQSVQDGNIRGTFAVSVTITPASVAAASAPEQAFTVPGVQPTDLVIDVTMPSVLAGVTLGGFRVTAANTVGIQFVNPTAGALVPPAGAYKFTVARIDGPYLGIAQ